MSLPFDPQSLVASTLFNVDGWVAVVTGGGTGLGAITASALAVNGARVYITGRTMKTLEKSIEVHDAASDAKGRIIPFVCDVTQKQDIKNLVEFISSRESKVNLLVNNAGIGGTPNDFTKANPLTPESVSDALFNGSEPQTWHDIMEINASAMYFMTAAFIPLLCASAKSGGPSGSVINVSSMSGITKQSQGGQFSYNAAKAATISLSNQLAFELRRPELNIRVNTIAPGYFPSEMTPASNYASGIVKVREEWGIPLGRQGNATEYAQAILQLAVNQYVTGDVLVIDGGWLLEQS